MIQTYFITQLPQLEQNSKERYKTKKTKQINDTVAIEITSDDEDDNHDHTNYTAIVTKHFYKKICLFYNFFDFLLKTVHFLNLFGT